MRMKRLFLIVFSYSFILSICFATPSPTLTAEGAILMEARTGQILYEKNALYPFYPASTTKVLTTLLLAEDFNIDAAITKSEQSVIEVPSDSSHIGLNPGDSYSYRDGLHAILMGSDNFVSHDMAVYNSESIEAFSEKMNARARKMGAYASHFVNPHGYHDENHYTTPFDLALITQEAFSNPIVEQIAGTPMYNFTLLNTGKVIPLKHTAQFFNADSPYYNPHVVAAKTGYHTPAGRTLVAKAIYDDIELIAVVMRSGNPTYFEDINTLFAYGADNFKTSLSESGLYTIQNVSYSPWAKPYVEEALAKGYYIQNLKNYMDATTSHDFYVLLQNRLGYNMMLETKEHATAVTPSLHFAPLSLSKTQQILTQVAATNGFELPSDFVSASLSKVHTSVPTLLSLEDVIYIQQEFMKFFFTHYPPYSPLCTIFFKNNLNQ